MASAPATRDNAAGRGKPEPRPGAQTALKAQALEVERDEQAAEEDREAAEAAAREAWDKKHQVLDPYRPSKSIVSLAVFI